MTYPGYEIWPDVGVFPGDHVPGYEDGDSAFSNPCSGIITDPVWLQEMWIGVPGQMYRLPMPEVGYSDTLHRSEVRHDLLSGGVAITRRAKTRRDWALSFPYKTETDAALIRLLYSGAWGSGPFSFYDPASRNQLSTVTSLSGAISALPPNWAVNSGSLAPQSVFTDPTPPVTGAGVVGWSGFTSVSSLGFNGVAVSGTLIEPIPWLEGRKMSFTFFVRTKLGPISITGMLVDSDGNTIGTVKDSASITANQNYWQRLVVEWDMTEGGTAGATPTKPYVIPIVQTNAAASGDTLYVSAPQVEYIHDDAPYSSSPWVVGFGPARVHLSDPLGGSNPFFWFRSYDLALAEA